MQAANPIAATRYTILRAISAKNLLSTCVIALAVVHAPARAGGPEIAQPAATAEGRLQRVGTFTGKYVNGLPVYQLPTVNVVANRKTVIAEIEQEDKLAQSRAAGTRSAVQPERAVALARRERD